MKVQKTTYKEVTELDYTLCDKCGEKIEIDDENRFDCNLELTMGRSCYDIGEVTIRKIDLCEKCAVLLFKQLQQDGYKVEIKEYDW